MLTCLRENYVNFSCELSSDLICYDPNFVLILECCRHGIRQITSGWADGPAYVTQCPIQTNQSYTYNFTIVGQRGTLLWHAHISWLRATIYGPIIILPKHNESYPFQKPYKEIPILFGILY